MTTSIDFPIVLPRLEALLTRGLCVGMGSADGQMCIESVIAIATGEPFSDKPTCVEPAVRAFSIPLNDAPWSSPQARAAGLRALLIAQIGSRDVVNGDEFGKRLAEKHIRTLIPTLFRKVFPDNPACLAAAARCEQEGTAEAAEAAWGAAEVARAAWAAARAAAARAAAEAPAEVAKAAAERAEWAAWAAADAAEAAAEAAASAAWAAKATEAAARAAWVAKGAAEAAEAAAEVARAERTAKVAKGAAEAAWGAAGDKYLRLSASLAVGVLRELGSPGCAFLPTEEESAP